MVLSSPVANVDLFEHALAKLENHNMHNDNECCSFFFYLKVRMMLYAFGPLFVQHYLEVAVYQEVSNAPSVPSRVADLVYGCCTASGNGERLMGY
jgi:hypothetical protein